MQACYRGLEADSVQDLTWTDYDLLIEAINQGEGAPAWPVLDHFEYVHPTRLQDVEFGVGKPYSVRLSYSDAGGSGEPAIAIGGLTNVKQRFDFFAVDAKPELRLIALDLAGRGESGWLAELSDYTLECYAEQLAQFAAHLKLDQFSVLGSSLGAAIAIRFAAARPDMVKSLILNDSGPYIPATRRRRRARAVARHYAFHSPSEMFRRTGASAKHVGPAFDAVLLRNAHYKTQWSESEQARVYRHDLRAMLAYRASAVNDLDLWSEWSLIGCPTLLLHGEQSDATSQDTIARMFDKRPSSSVIHIAKTGHTPSLSFARLNRMIVRWHEDPASFERSQNFDVARQTKRVLYPDA